MSYTTEFSPCGHHVSKLKLIGKTKTDPEHPKALDIWQCECGKIYMNVAGFHVEVSEEDWKKLIEKGLATLHS